MNHLNEQLIYQTDFFKCKNDYKEFYVVQQSVLLSLLNNYCDIILTHQKKQSVVTSSFPLLLTLQFENEEPIDIQDLADKMCRPLYQQELQSVNKRQTAVRRFEKNKKSFVQHLLIDMLREKGIVFESKMSRKSSKTQQFERIEKIYVNGKLFMNFKQFISKGYQINTLINDMLTRCIASKMLIKKQTSGFVTSI